VAEAVLGTNQNFKQPMQPKKKKKKKRKEEQDLRNVLTVLFFLFQVQNLKVSFFRCNIGVWASGKKTRLCCVERPAGAA
jgi:hypothetical protein